MLFALQKMNLYDSVLILLTLFDILYEIRVLKYVI